MVVNTHQVWFKSGLNMLKRCRAMASHTFLCALCHGIRESRLINLNPFFLLSEDDLVRFSCKSGGDKKKKKKVGFTENSKCQEKFYDGK